MHKRRPTSTSDLFTDLHCAEEDDAAFFIMPFIEGNPITMWRSDTNTHKHTHTHTHTRARTHTHFLRNDKKGRMVLFFSFFVFFFFPLCLRVSLVSLAIHLVFSSCGTRAQTHTSRAMGTFFPHTVSSIFRLSLTRVRAHTAITFACASLH